MAQLGSSKIFGDLQVTGDIKYNDQLISNIVTGTAPLAVASTTLVPNLNADLLDGNHASAFALASQVLTNVPLNAKFTDTVYTHPTTSGNKHIPSGGASGQVLKYSADGTATWGDNDVFLAGATAPSNTKLLWIDTNASTGGLKYYNGTAWVTVPVGYTS